MKSSGRTGVLIVIVFIYLLMLTAGGCGKKPQKKPVEVPVQIGVSVSSLDQDVADLVKKTYQQREQQDHTHIVWTDAGRDPALQEKQVDELIRRKVKAIIIQVTDPAMGPVLSRKIMEQNIKLLAIGSLPPDTPLDGYVAPDYYRMGELQGRYLVDQRGGMQGSQQVLLLRGDPDDYLTRQMTAGFNAVTGPAGLAVTVRNFPGREPADQSSVIPEDLTKNLGAVVAQSDELLQAALRDLVARGQTAGVITIGAGGGKEAAHAMARGELNAEADAMPEMVARYAYQAAVDLLKTGKWEDGARISNVNHDVPAKIIPVRLVEPVNLYLLEQRWGKLTDSQKGGQGGDPGSGSQKGDSQQQDQGSNQDPGQGSEQGKSKTSSGGTPGAKVKIKTKEGKTVEIQIDGEIESISIEKPAGETPKKQ